MHKLTRLSIVAALLAAAPARGGERGEMPLLVSPGTPTSNGGIWGIFAQVRATPDAVQYLNVRVIVTRTSSSALISAKDAAGVTASCTTTDPVMVEAIMNTPDDAMVHVIFNTSRICTFYEQWTASFTAPMAP